MPGYNHNFNDEKQPLLLAWLIVLFAFVILFLIWQSHGYF
jgi:hypothetical protein